MVPDGAREKRSLCSLSSLEDEGSFCGPHGLCYVHLPSRRLVAKLEGQLKMAEKCLSKL